MSIFDNLEPGKKITIEGRGPSESDPRPPEIDEVLKDAESRRQFFRYLNALDWLDSGHDPLELTGDFEEALVRTGYMRDEERSLDKGDE
jgi:hypothetical protein